MSLACDIEALYSLHPSSIERWYAENEVRLIHQGFLALVEENHAFNFQLWQAEDRARRDDKGYEFVYRAKREIDHCNQQRNNRMEAMDEWLFHQLAPSTNTTCPIHSETPGMIIDRLSILSLKAYHMAIQTTRSDVEETHRQSCQRKLTVIQLQRQQLQDCFRQLLHDIMDHKRSFRVYHQFKMYNDKTLNPQLYEH